MTAATKPLPPKQQMDHEDQRQPTPPDDHRIVLYGFFSCVYYGWEICAGRRWDKVPLLAFRFLWHVSTLWYTIVLAAKGRNDGVSTGNSTSNGYRGRMLVRPITAIFLLEAAFDKFQQMPCIWDSDTWSMQMDTFFAIWLLAFPRNDDTGIDDEIAFSTIRDMFANYYFAAAFWKVNSHFIDPDASCATMFFVQLVAQYVAPILNVVSTDPAASLITVASVAKAIAPVGALIVELAVGGFMVVGSLLSNSHLQSVGSFSALAFHLMVCSLPAPNDISGFALNCAPRHIVFASALGTHEGLNFVGRHALPIGAALAVGLGMAIQSDKGWTENNWAFLLYIFVGGFAALSISYDLSRHYGYSPPDVAPQCRKQEQQPLSNSSNRKTGRMRSLLSKTAVGVAFFYSFVTLMLGVQEEGTANMFANLKVHGGSNHYVLPTGLLFHWFGPGSDGTIDDSHPYGGGVIRLENTTSDWLRTIYPADLTRFLMPTNVVDVLAAIGRPSPVYFNPGANRNLALLNEVPHQFYRYTVPALEFKRLLHEAKERDKTFDVTYSKLPGTSGDEVWRATATEKVFTVKVQDGIVVECNYQRVVGNQRNLEMPRECEKSDLPWINFTQTVPRIIRHIGMYHAYPIVAAFNATEIPPSIVCFGP